MRASTAILPLSATSIIERGARPVRGFRAACGLGLAAALLAGTSVLAQEAVTSTAPPVKSSVDAHGVDLISGALEFSVPMLTVGKPGQGGLSYGRTFIGTGWRDSPVGVITTSGSTYMVSIGAATEAFTNANTVFTPQAQSGSTLSYNGSTRAFTYTTSDGSTALFTPSATPGKGPWGAGPARLTQTRTPTGEVTDFSYSNAYQCGRLINGEPCANPYPVEVLSSYRNNLGYEIDLVYEDTQATDADPNLIFRTAYVAGYNHAVSASAQISISLTSINRSSGAARTLTDPLGRVSEFAYDNGDGILTGYHFPQGSASGFTVGYDRNNRVISITTPTGAWSYAYADSGSTRTTTVTDPLGHTRTVVSDLTTSLIATDSDGLGRTTSYAYDGAGRLTQIARPSGAMTQYTYDGRGNVVQTVAVGTPAQGSPTITTSAGYDATCAGALKCNKPNYTIDARGARTDYGYGAGTGLLTSVIAPAGANGLRPETDYFYVRPYAFYDQGSGQATQASSPVWRLGTVSRCATAQSCLNAADATQTHLDYGPQSSGTGNNLLATTVTKGAGDGSLAATAQAAYDAVGDVVSTTDPLGNPTRYRYDAARQLTGVVGPDPDGSGPLKNRAVRYTYDGAGRPTLVERGMVLSASDGDWANFYSLASSATVYDAAGRTVRRSSMSGGATWAVAQYDYDAADRLTCSAVRMNPAIFFGQLPGSACGQGTFGVYGADRITQYGYDAADQAIRVTSGAGSPVQRDEVTTSYGPDGEVTTQADAKGQLTTLYYHAFDRLGAVCYPTTSNPTASNPNDCERYGYDANGNTTSNTRRDGQVIGYAYDALNRLTSGALGATYAYDNLGRVTQATRNGQATSFGYDALGRQTSETGPLGTVRRQFDLNGNRTLLTWPDGFAISYFHDAVGELLYTNDGVVQPTHHTWNDLGQVNALYRSNGVNSAFAYGGDQRLSAITHAFPNTAYNQSYSFTYNPAGQVASSSSSNPAYDWTAGYTVARGYGVDGQNKYTASGGLALSYDGRGNLANDGVTGFGYDVTDKLTSLSNGATLSYDAADRLAQTTGGATTRFLYDGDQIIGEYDASGNVLRRYVPGPGTDQPIVWYEGSGTSDRRFLITDRQGSVTAVTNASGGVLAINTYDEAGIPGPNNTGRFQYNAAPFIPEAGLYHMRARAYSPTLGRFMQPDPIGYGDGMNVYNYVHGDPVNGWDPSGLDTEICTNGVTVDTSTKEGAAYAASSACRTTGEVTVTGTRGGGGGFGGGFGGDGGGGVIGRIINSISSAIKSFARKQGSCPSGPYISASYGASGTAAFLVGLNVSASVSVSHPVVFNILNPLQGTQVSASAQLGGMSGYGAFAGAGSEKGVGLSPGPSKPGLSPYGAYYGEADLGFGPAYGGSLQVGADSSGWIDPKSTSGAIGGKFGAGLGGYAGAGAAGGITFASPTFGC